MGSVSSRLAERSEVGPPPIVDAPRIYLPAVAIVAAAFTLIAVGWSSHWGGASFAASMTDQRVVVVGPLTLGILAVILVVERVRPAQIRPLVARGHRQDALYTVLNATLVVPLVVALSLSFATVARQDLPWIVVPQFGFLPRWAVITLIFVAMDALQLARAPRQPPGPRALALPRAAPLPRGHERAHGVPDPSPDPRVVPRRADPGDRAPGQRRGADGVARRLRGLRGVRALEHEPRVRPVGADLRQPQLPPHPPPARWAPRTSTSASRSRSGTSSSIGRCSRPRPRSAPTPDCRDGHSWWSRRATDRTTSPPCSASSGDRSVRSIVATSDVAGS